MARRQAGAVIAAMALAAACSSAGQQTAADPDQPTRTSALATTSTTTTTLPTSTTLTPTTAPPTTTAAEPEAETDVEVLAAFVEQHSGLSFEEVPEIEIGTVARDELGIDPGVFVDERLWDLFVPLGLVGPDDDRIAAGQARLDQVRGVCCPVILFETDDHPLLTSFVVVHELTHLIDRQRPLDRDVRSAEPFPFASIVLEGNAQRVAFRYQAELEAAGAPPSRFDLDWAEPRIPDAVLEVLELPYEEGATFTEALFERGGLELVEQSFVRPPTTTEQVLDVDAYLSDEQPVEVEAPALVGSDATATGTMGAFVVLLLAERSLDGEAAHELATSWAGDRYVLFERAGRACLLGTVVMDDPATASALVAALRDAGVGAMIDDGSPSALTVRRCARLTPLV